MVTTVVITPASVGAVCDPALGASASNVVQPDLTTTASASGQVDTRAVCQHNNGFNTTTAASSVEIKSPFYNL